MPKVLSIQNGNEILNNIFYLIETKGIRQKDLAEYLGLSQNAITYWKTAILQLGWVRFTR